MRINTNVASLNAQEAAKNTSNKLTSSLEKLSTGLKINKAADDASGLSIADKLRTQANSIGQGISNANSANSLIQIADKAMAEQSNILDTIKTKLIQASTSTTSEDGREAIRKDIQKLLEQFDNISAQTNYNGTNLLNEKDKEFVFQVGEDSSFDIGLKTEYAVNTSGLGSAGKESTTNATIKTTTGNITLEGEVSNVSTTISSTEGSLSISAAAASSASTVSEMSINVSANNVTKIGINNTTTTSTLTLSTDDADLAKFLNAEADKSTSDGLTKIANGVYEFKSTADATESSITFQNNASVDISNLKVSGISSLTTGGDIFKLYTDESVTIEKTGGTADLTLSSGGKMDIKVNGDTAEGIAYTAGSIINVTSGTVAVRDNATGSTLDVVTINATAAATTSETGNIAFTAASDANIKSLSLTNTASEATVTIATSDATTAQALRDAGLSENADGTFNWSTNGANNLQTLDFGTDGIKMGTLSFSDVSKTTSANDKIYIETSGTVTLANDKPEGIDEDYGNFSVSMTTSAGGSNTAGIGIADVNSGLAFKNLEGLTALGQGELTSETANNFMSVIDDALSQLNSVRSDFGSTQNQLDSAIRNMMTVQTNIQAAESVIRDVDYAEESANFNKQNIIAQAGSYAMSQSNAIQQNVLRLLQ